MNGNHQRGKRADRNVGDPGRHGLSDDTQGAKQQSGHGSHHRDAPGFCSGVGVSGYHAVDQRIGDEGGEKSEVKDVAPEREQAAVGKKQRLHREHRRYHEQRGVGAEQDGQDQSAAEMTTRSGAGNREVDHLRGKDKCAEHTHHRNDVGVQRRLDLTRAIGDQSARYDPKCSAHRR